MVVLVEDMVDVVEVEVVVDVMVAVVQVISS